MAPRRKIKKEPADMDYEVISDVGVGVKKIKSEPLPMRCILCQTDTNDEVMLGELLLSNSMCAHTNCLFFASGLGQRGDTEEGLQGFLEQDILAEHRRGRRLFCSYCKKRGATVGCCDSSCKKCFHLTCAIKSGSTNQHFETYPSYCKVHKPKQKKIKIDELLCNICCELIDPTAIDMCLYPPCCKKSYFHKNCLQQYAISAGFYFKCPLCNDTEKFSKEMIIHGINVPRKDASWELADNAYEELLQRPGCDAPICKCPRGRDYHPKKKSGWTIITCHLCGFHARHKNCQKIKSEQSWLCEECTITNDKIAMNKVAENSVSNQLQQKYNFCLSPRVELEDIFPVKLEIIPEECPNVFTCEYAEHTEENTEIPNSSDSDSKFETLYISSEIVASNPTSPCKSDESVEILEWPNTKLYGLITQSLELFDLDVPTASGPSNGSSINQSKSEDEVSVVAVTATDSSELPIVPGPGTSSSINQSKRDDEMSVVAVAATGSSVLPIVPGPSTSSIKIEPESEPEVSIIATVIPRRSSYRAANLGNIDCVYYGHQLGRTRSYRKRSSRKNLRNPKPENSKAEACSFIIKSETMRL